jgi:murein tripeptide amidase MpaA
MLHISSQFDSGAIEVIDVNDAHNIRLNLRADNASEFMQWFHFRLSGAKGKACTMHIENAGQSAYPDAWPDYQAVASYDRVNWFRVVSEFDGQVLTIHHTPEHEVIWFAYFEPYSWERHQALIGRVMTQSDDTQVELLGITPDGHDLDLIRVGTPADGKKHIWITARQHPGESMAEWFVEGVLDALLDPNHGVSRELLKRYVFYIVPNMNPDGSVRGNLRTNAKGTNLNREWLTPSLAYSPEVYWVREKMQQIGVDAFFDIHGDEAIPHVFVAGCEHLRSFSDKQHALQDQFKSHWQSVTPDFQTTYGYTDKTFGDDTLLKLASNWVGDRFDCLALTIEMPFKDTADTPVPAVGWNGERSKQLGQSWLTALYLTPIR